jgi:hypothetical protein
MKNSPFDHFSLKKLSVVICGSLIALLGPTQLSYKSKRECHIIESPIIFHFLPNIPKFKIH